VRQHGARRQHGCGRQSRRREGVKAFGHAARGAPACQSRAEFRPVGPARGIVGKARIGDPLRVADQARDAAEHRIADHLQQHMTVGGGKHIGRPRELCPVSGAGPVEAKRRFLDQAARHGQQRGPEQRGGDALPASRRLPLAQRGQHAERRERGRQMVHVMRMGLPRHAPLARQVHRTRHRLADAVEARAIGPGPFPEGRDGGEDQPRVQRVQPLRREAHRGERTVGHVGDDDVAPAQQRIEQRALRRIRGVQHERALAAVELEMDRPARRILADRLHEAVRPAAGPLDADHLGAHLGQHQRAERACDEQAEVEHAHAGERRRAHHGRASPGTQVEWKPRLMRCGTRSRATGPRLMSAAEKIWHSECQSLVSVVKVMA
jgi:hypothetical protein